VLMALTEKLFDSVPLDRMPEAERAVREASATLPDDLQARFDTATQLSDADRATIVRIAHTALARFQTSVEQKSETGHSTRPKSASTKSS
jgi:F-type H+-transporting ATPase subunit alpha